MEYAHLRQADLAKQIIRPSPCTRKTTVYTKRLERSYGQAGWGRALVLRSGVVESQDVAQQPGIVSHGELSGKRRSLRNQKVEGKEGAACTANFI